MRAWRSSCQNWMLEDPILIRQICTKLMGHLLNTFWMLITVTNSEEVEGLKQPVINIAYHRAHNRPCHTGLRTTVSNGTLDYFCDSQLGKLSA